MDLYQFIMMMKICLIIFTDVAINMRNSSNFNTKTYIW